MISIDNRRFKDNSGVSPIVSTLLILLLMLTMISTVLLWGTPVIEDYEATNQYESMKGLMFEIDNSIETLERMGEFSGYSTKITIPPGSLGVGNEGEFWSVSFSYPNPTISPNTFYDYYGLEQEYVDGPGTILIKSNYNRSVNIMTEWLETNLTGYQINNSLSPEYELTITQSLSRPFRITLLGNEDIPLSRCYVFPINSITGEFISPKGNFDFRSVNGAVVTEYPDNSDPKWLRKPSVLHNIGYGIPLSTGNDYSTVNEAMIINMYNFLSTGLSKTGKGHYGMDITNTHLEMYNELGIQNIKIHIYGKYRDCLYDSLSYSRTQYTTESNSLWMFHKDKDNETVILKNTEVNSKIELNTIDLTINHRLFEVDLYKE